MSAGQEPGGAAGSLLSSYEELRRVAVRRSDHSGRGAGFALFIRSGMAAWIEACAPLARPVEASPRRESAEQHHVPPDLHAEVAMVLAEMALSAHAQGAPT